MVHARDITRCTGNKRDAGIFAAGKRSHAAAAFFVKESVRCFSEATLEPRIDLAAPSAFSYKGRRVPGKPRAHDRWTCKKAQDPAPSCMSICRGIVRLPACPSVVGRRRYPCYQAYCRADFAIKLPAQTIKQRTTHHTEPRGKNG